MRYQQHGIQSYHKTQFPHAERNGATVSLQHLSTAPYKQHTVHILGCKNINDIGNKSHVYAVKQSV
jgi:hypothetical protein